MKNLILILVILLTGEIFSQVTAPSGYTTNYNFRKWVQGANPSADSINANWDALDARIKIVYDSAQAKLNTYGNQTIATGTKTFTGGTIALNGARLIFGTSAITSPINVGEIATTASRTYITYTNVSGTDTLATLANIRSGSGGYAMLSGASFTGDVSVGQDLRTPYDSLTISSTTVSADNKTFIQLWTNGASPEDLETISDGSDGKIVYLLNIDAGGNAITVKDNVGNIQTAGDFVMGLGDTMVLIYNSVDSKWYELSRSNN